MPDTTVKQIAEALRTDTLCVLCGAGISLYSGIPLAGELVHEILKRLGIADTEQEEFLKVGLAFEEVMEALIEATGTEHIFRLFQGDLPNRNHILVAKLAAGGVVRTIMTTNFDTLLETALSNETVPYDIVYTDSQLENVCLDADKLQVIKLHGHIDDRTSLAVTIKRVANRSLVERRWKAVRSTFVHPCTTKILVLGYSFSDRFDIIPAISSITGCRKQLIVINHSASAEIAVCRLGDQERYPFLTHFDGFLVDCDTDEFMAALWQLYIAEQPPCLAPCAVDWRQELSRWLQAAIYDQCPEITKYMAGLLFAKAGLYGKAITYLSEAGQQGVLPDLRAAACQKMGDNYRDLGSYDHALEWLNKSLICSRKDKLLRRQARVLCSLGIVKEDLGQHARAIKFFRQALTLAKRTGDRELEGKCHGNVGIALKNMGSTESLKKAIRSHKKSLLIARELGDKRSEGRTLGNLGIAYSDIGDKHRAIRYYLEALTIAEDLRDLRHMGIWMANAGEDYIGIDQEKAAKYLRSAVEIFGKLSLMHYIPGLEQLLATLPVRDLHNSSASGA